jgi:tripartite ATP-independent transporter DctM subunit
VIYRELKLENLYRALVASGKMTSVVMFMVAAAMVSSWLITVANIPAELTAMLGPLMDNQLLLLIGINVLIILVGTAMDLTPTILIMTPVLMPIIVAAKIDPVYFGLLFILNNSIGLLTPPVGTVLNVAAGVGRISMDDIMKGVWPFLLAEVIVLLLLTIFPQLVMVPFGWFTR